jgi:CubicO group peptidase (beta-lactamase class C family)
VVLALGFSLCPVIVLADSEGTGPAATDLFATSTGQMAEPRATYWPTHGWRNSTPEAQGIDSAVLADALDAIHARHIPVNSLLIERHGNIVLDAYFYPYAGDRPHQVFSVTKSVTASLVGIAVSDGKLASLDTPLDALLPDQMPVEADKSHITLAHLLSMTSGLDCSNSQGLSFLQQMERSPHWVSYALERPEVAEPGTRFGYCAGNMHVVSAVLTRVTGESAADYARARLFSPLGITEVSWPKDSDGISHGFADLELAPRDMAKLGYLWLHHGVWEGRQIIPATYLADATTPHASVEPGVQYGYGMWIYPARGHAGGPPDFEANGVGGQRIAVVPSQDMVEVITGQGLDANEVASLVAGAVKSDTPLADNPIALGRLETDLAEARGRIGFALAAVNPQPRPAPEPVTNSITPVPPAVVTPKPRPEMEIASAGTFDVSQFTVAPRPRPTLAAISAGADPSFSTVRPKPRPAALVALQPAGAAILEAGVPKPRSALDLAADNSAGGVLPLAAAPKPRPRS